MHISEVLVKPFHRAALGHVLWVSAGLQNALHTTPFLPCHQKCKHFQAASLSFEDPPTRTPLQSNCPCAHASMQDDGGDISYRSFDEDSGLVTVKMHVSRATAEGLVTGCG